MREGVKPAEIPDLDLAQKIVDGSDDAFDQLYTRHNARVLKICRRMTNETDASDLAQETWTTVFKKIADFRMEAAFTTWLHRITVNVCLLYIRKHKNETKVDEERWSELPSSGLPTDKGFEQDDLVSKFLVTLVESDRRIFVLRVFKGMKPNEISNLLKDSSPQYVSNRFMMLKKRFAEFICGEKRKGGDSKI